MSTEYVDTRHDRLTSQLCSEIDVLEWRLEEKERELQEMTEKYNNLLNSSLESSQRATFGILTLALSGKIRP